MNITEHMKNLFQLLPIKLASVAVLTGWENQIWMMMAFFLLVFMDCFTRWLAISGQCLKERGVAHPSLWEEIQALGTARREGKINSSTMKKRGLEKLLLYNLCLITAGIADFLMVIPLLDVKLMDLTVSYLAMTETLSILENLSDAGVASMGELISKVGGKQ